jgi:hypothetical protein
VGNTPQEHHHIGVSQNRFEHIGTFLRQHAGDPAVQVLSIQEMISLWLMSPFPQNFLPKLRQHLIPRFLSKLQGQSGIALASQDIDPNSVLFKNDRIYHHNIMRINYTTYDVRRSQDVVNASTSHHNVMVLASNADHLASGHPFRYARVLGVYHVNVVYTGPGMINYEPLRLEFIWVRWYKTVDTITTGWDARKLDLLQIASMAEDNAFSFCDPSDLLRACHIIPAFARGRLHADGKGLSSLARDSSNWNAYYNR